MAEAAVDLTLTESWLSLQCQMIAGVARGALLVPADESGSLQAVATWPAHGQPVPELQAAAEAAVAARRGLVQPHQNDRSAQPRDIVAYPVLIDGRLLGVVVLELHIRADAEQQGVLHLLKWSSTWLEVLLRRYKPAMPDDRALATVVELMATALEPETFRATAITLATELAVRLACDRVSIGLLHGKHVRVEAVSHNAQVNARTGLLRGIGAAMDEAIDQDSTVVHPAPEQEKRVRLTRAHAELGRGRDGVSLCTIPLSRSGRVIGAITLERPRERPFDSELISLCEHAAALLGPLLDVRHHEDRWLIRHAVDSLREQLARLFGPGHVWMKTIGATLAALILLPSIINGDYRVAARATLEGTVQRVVIAPQEGFIATANVRAGDMVRTGQVMGTLDDKDMRLEHLKWSNQRAQYVQEYRSALAAHDRSKVTILSAQVAQAEAQLQLLDEQLARTQLTAPFDGIVVSGDLSQRLGSPVERGDVLFEVAPLDGYRIILQVDESEIAGLRAEQPGVLALSALPQEKFPFTVTAITPVSTAEDGRNYFRVEATLAQTPDMLRPGMEGIGKVLVGERKLIWIWTHKLFDWLRLWTWSQW